MIWLGCDPGLSGAIAALDADGALLWCVDMPVCDTGVDGPVLASLLRELRGTGVVATVEQPITVKGKGLAGTLKQGDGYGIVRGVCYGLGITTHTVHPRTWQALLTKGWPGGAKQRAVAVAESRWPEADLRGPRGRALDGRADALHVAEYGRLTWRQRL